MRLSMMDGREHGASNVVMIPPGKSREMAWTFFEDQQIEFGCNAPGDSASGMRGSVTIEGQALVSSGKKALIRTQRKTVHAIKA